MDYLKLTSDEAKYIDSLFAKDITELTNEELTVLTEYKASWIAYNKYFDAIKEERSRTDQVIQAYDQILADESQKRFNEMTEAIINNRYILEDD